MNNKFSLSFGLSLIIVGILNFFLDTSNIIIFGLSFSALLFSIINIIISKIDDDKYEIMYLIPLVFLITIFCYSSSLMKYSIIEEMVNGKATNILTFISFGLLFYSEYYNNQQRIKKEREFDRKEILNIFGTNRKILNMTAEYLKKMTRKKMKPDEETMNFINEIKEFTDNEFERATFATYLTKNNKQKYMFDEIISAYTQSKYYTNKDKNGK